MVKKILVAYEEHRTRYFNASSNEDIRRASLKLLQERFALGYVYRKPEPPKEKPELSEEQIKDLPDDSKVKEFAIKQWKRYKSELSTGRL